MRQPACAHIARGFARQEEFVARAKRTNRTEARRRYRAEQVAPDGDSTTDVVVETAPAKGKGTSSAAPARSKGAAPAPRPGIMASFRAAYRPVDLRGDLRAAPMVLTHWGFLVACAIAIAASAIFVIATNDFASAIDFSASSPMEGKTIGTTSNHLVPHHLDVRHAAAGRGRVPDRLHGQARELAGGPCVRHRGGRVLRGRPVQPRGKAADLGPARQRLHRPGCGARPNRRRPVRLRGRVVPPVPRPGQPESQPAARQAERQRWHAGKKPASSSARR